MNTKCQSFVNFRKLEEKKLRQQISVGNDEKHYEHNQWLYYMSNDYYLVSLRNKKMF